MPNMLALLYLCFKPYYKWNTFNTFTISWQDHEFNIGSFKPYYKWNTFNTHSQKIGKDYNLEF